ncbi:MAG: hypothetical protein PF569_01515 [Candidatus Woesearchaeota archaeon]|jgi:hypothetical protein|nr:hypothetical protein [Candidatus Woesearchaeota archaeon]
MLVYKDRSFCFTKECLNFDKKCRGLGAVANEELLKEAEDFGLPVDTRTFELDSENKPINCWIFEELNKK